MSAATGDVDLNAKIVEKDLQLGKSLQKSLKFCVSAPPHLKKITQAIKTFQDVPESSIPCYTCIHNCKEKCSIGFLEFMSTDATDCSAYKKID